MFTGIVEEMGTVKAIRKGPHSAVVEIQAQVVLEDLHIGDSIAVNGVCLTATAFSPAGFTADVMHETLNRSALALLRPGSRVNLERALALGDRLGGHLVSGHVDCVATVRSVEQAGSSLRCTLAFPPAFAAEVIEKGSVTLDGISLTINACGKDFLTVNVIPDTQKRTTMLHWRPGSRVNMETDLIGKYVRRIMQCQADGPATPQKSSGINKEFLLQNGFL